MTTMTSAQEATCDSLTATCETLCSSLQFDNVTVAVDSCDYHTAGSTFEIVGASSICGSTATAQVDLCRVALSVATSNASENYMEVWLPTEWNGRFLATDNKGLAGCKFGPISFTRTRDLSPLTPFSFFFLV